MPEKNDMDAKKESEYPDTENGYLIFKLQKDGTQKPALNYLATIDNCLNGKTAPNQTNVSADQLLGGKKIHSQTLFLSDSIDLLSNANQELIITNTSYKKYDQLKRSIATKESNGEKVGPGNWAETLIDTRKSPLYLGLIVFRPRIRGIYDILPILIDWPVHYIAGFSQYAFNQLGCTAANIANDLKNFMIETIPAILQDTDANPLKKAISLLAYPFAGAFWLASYAIAAVSLAAGSFCGGTRMLVNGACNLISSIGSAIGAIFGDKSYGTTYPEIGKTLKSVQNGLYRMLTSIILPFVQLPLVNKLTAYDKDNLEKKKQKIKLAEKKRDKDTKEKEKVTFKEFSPQKEEKSIFKKIYNLFIIPAKTKLRRHSTTIQVTSKLRLTSKNIPEKNDVEKIDQKPEIASTPSHQSAPPVANEQKQSSDFIKQNVEVLQSGHLTETQILANHIKSAGVTDESDRDTLIHFLEEDNGRDKKKSMHALLAFSALENGKIKEMTAEDEFQLAKLILQLPGEYKIENNQLKTDNVFATRVLEKIPEVSALAINLVKDKEFKIGESSNLKRRNTF